MTGASQATGLGAPEGAEPCGLGATPAIPSAAFSPGPWKLGGRKKYRVEIDAPKDRFPWSGLAKVVVRMKGDEKDYYLGIANANLIAAAPELYNALFLLAHDSKQISDDPLRLQALQALAKARGEQVQS